MTMPIMISALDTFVDFLFDYLKDTLCGTLSNDTLFRILVLVCQSLVLYWNRNTKINVKRQKKENEFDSCSPKCVLGPVPSRASVSAG